VFILKQNSYLYSSKFKKKKEKLFAFTRYHKNSNYHGDQKTYDCAYVAHEAIEKEIKIDEHIERSKILHGEYFRFSIEKNETCRYLIHKFLSQNGHNERHEFEETVSPE